MAKRYNETEYLYLSARIRAIENSLVGQEKLVFLTEQKTTDDIIAALLSFGLPKVLDAEGNIDTEAMLLTYFKNGVKTVKEALPHPTLLLPIEYPYDCHNIKSYLKCTLRGIDPAELMIDTGSIPVSDLLEILKEKRGDALPPHMATAFPQAEVTYAKTRDPRDIDFILDRAAFADMHEAAADLPFAASIVAAKADLTNIFMAIRLLRSENPAIAPLIFHKASVPGGILPQDILHAALQSGDMRTLITSLHATPYGDIAAKCTDSFAAAEKTADDYVMRLVKTAKQIPFGAEIPLAYLFALEVCIKNIRLILAGKMAGLAGNTLKERVRESYV